MNVMTIDSKILVQNLGVLPPHPCLRSALPRIGFWEEICLEQLCWGRLSWAAHGRKQGKQDRTEVEMSIATGNSVHPAGAVGLQWPFNSDQNHDNALTSVNCSPSTSPSHWGRCNGSLQPRAISKQNKTKLGDKSSAANSLKRWRNEHLS